VHVREPGDPGACDAQPTRPAREEDRLASVAFEEPLGRRQHAIAEAADGVVALEEPASEQTARPVAGVVSENRGDGADDDHLGQREVPLRRQDRSGDECGLAGERHTRRLEGYHEEHDEEPVLLDEVRHRVPRVRAS
jgi:hypothetical protein